MNAAGCIWCYSRSGTEWSKIRQNVNSESKVENRRNIRVHPFKIFYLFIFRQREGRKKERKRNINVWLPLVRPHLGTWPTAQSCAMTGNRTGNPSVHRLVLNPLSHTSQGYKSSFFTAHEIWIGEKTEGEQMWETNKTKHVGGQDTWFRDNGFPVSSLCAMKLLNYVDCPKSS